MWCMGGAPGGPTHSSKERTSVPHASQLAQLTAANMLRGISSFARGRRGHHGRGDAACSTHTRVQIKSDLCRDKSTGPPSHTRRTDIPLSTSTRCGYLHWDGFCGHGWMQLASETPDPPTPPASLRPPPIRPTCPEGPAVSQAVSSTLMPSLPLPTPNPAIPPC